MRRLSGICGTFSHVTARGGSRKPEHPDTLGSRNNLAGAYYAQGRYNEAARHYEETLSVS